MEQNLIPLLLLLQPVLRADGQYQLVREDPFAQLSSTLQTWQSAACDGEFTHLRCPEGAKVILTIYRACNKTLLLRKKIKNFNMSSCLGRNKIYNHSTKKEHKRS